MKETDSQVFSTKNINQFYQTVSPLTAESLRNKAESLEVPLTEKEAEKIIRMVNYSQGSTGEQISPNDLQTVLQKDD